MKDTLKQLQALQGIDTELQKAEEELQAMPAELSSRDHEIQALRDKVTAHQDKIKKTKAEAHDQENEIKEREAKIVKYDGDANSVKDNAQLFAIQHQIKSLREEIGKYEDKVLTLFSEIEKMEEEAAGLGSELKEGEEVHKRFQKSVHDEIAKREEDKKKLLAQREDAAKDINPEVLDKYNRLLKARDGQAMASVDGTICQGCYMELLPNEHVKLLNGKVLVQCKNCTRILFIPAEEKSS